MTEPTGLQKTVFENLDNGLDNAPEIAEWSAHDLTRDLMAYASDVEERSYDELLPHVAAWLEQRKTK